MKSQKLLLAFSALSLCLAALFFFGSHKKYYVLQARPGAGLFSMFSDVLPLLHSYDQGEIGGFEVDFGKEGVYFSEEWGDNWWNYYCEPLRLGSKIHVEKGFFGAFSITSEKDFWTSRRQIHALIQKYIHFKPSILQQVKDFAECHFINKTVITVHYRGTDWFVENAFALISYARFAQEVQHVIDKLPNNTNYQIFIATDEQAFIQYMQKQFPKRICFLEENYRAEDATPLHKSPAYNPAKQGEEAIVDCLLLSKGDYFIGTCSNLSQWALFLNPDMQAVDLTQKLTWIDR